MRPRIGITTSYNNDQQELAHHYVRAIEAAGGLPLIVPMLENKAAAREFASLLHGLVMTGGPAIVKGLIGNLPEDIDPVHPMRDSSDTLIYQQFSDNRPVLGICYGMQFINAQHGGTIYADVAAQKDGATVHSPGRGATEHPILLQPNTHLHRILGTDSMTVNTYHIQAVVDLGEGLVPTAYSDDGVLEAFESPDGRMIGVQFHPERMTDATMPLFRDFIDRCRNTVPAS